MCASFDDAEKRCKIIAFSRNGQIYCSFSSVRPEHRSPIRCGPWILPCETQDSLAQGWKVFSARLSVLLRIKKLLRVSGGSIPSRWLFLHVLCPGYCGRLMSLTCRSMSKSKFCSSCFSLLSLSVCLGAAVPCALRMKSMASVSPSMKWPKSSW